MLRKILVCGLLKRSISHKYLFEILALPKRGTCQLLLKKEKKKIKDFLSRLIHVMGLMHMWETEKEML